MSTRIRISDDLAFLIRELYPNLDLSVIISKATVLYLESRKQELSDEQQESLKFSKAEIAAAKSKRASRYGWSVENHIKRICYKIMHNNYEVLYIIRDHEIFMKSFQNDFSFMDKIHLDIFTPRHIERLRCSLNTYKEKFPKEFFFIRHYAMDYDYICKALKEKGLHPDQTNLFPEKPQPFTCQDEIELKKPEDTDDEDLDLLENPEDKV